MEITFDTRGNEKQKQCASFWIDDETEEIVYGGSKGCFIGSTLVNTSLGHKPIKNISIGDLVLTINEQTKLLEYKKVLKLFKYGGDFESQFITFVFDDGKNIKCTSNHEFYYQGDWVSAFELAKIKNEKSSFGECKSFSIGSVVANEIDLDSIKGIIFTSENTEHYDIHVEDNHNYCITERNIIVHNSGKSFLGCSLILGDALIYPETFYFIARKTLKDLRKFTIPSIQEVLGIWNISDKYYKYNGQDSCFRFYNGSRVYLLDAKYLPSDPQFARFGSMQMTRGWIEEAGEFTESCKNNLQISIGRWKNQKYGLKGKLLQTCNPAKNYLYPVYKLNKTGKLEKRVKFIQALPQDNKMLDDGYLESLNNILTSSEKERLLKGNWEYDDDPDVLCDYEKILDLFHNDHIGIDEQGNEIYDKSKQYLTCDIAAYGSDKFRIGRWNEWRLKEVQSFDLSGGSLVVGAIKHLQSKYNIPQRNIVFDSDGVGGLIGGKTGFFPRAIPFYNGGKPLVPKKGEEVEQYQNAQAQCCYKLAEKVNSNEIHIDAELTDEERKEIIEELESLKRKPDNGTKLAIVDKKVTKELLGRSPDWRDMMMMRMAFEYKAKKTTIAIGKKGRSYL